MPLSTRVLPLDGILLTLPRLWAATTENIFGTVLDPSGAITLGRTLTATNTATGVERATTTNDKGFFAFPSLPAGRYEFKVDREGFSPPRLTSLVVEAHRALQADTTLTRIEKIEQVTVLANDFHVETSSTPASEVVTGTAITALHGCSFTGLLGLEPGIVPMTIEQPQSTVMARASVAIAPAGILNPRNQSISGRREDAQDWSISGITRASTGFAVTISSDGDNSLMGSVPNGVNNHLDLPGYAPGWLNLNSNPQNGRLYFNRSLFSADALGTPGTASRRSFHGPGMAEVAQAKVLGSARILPHLQPRSVSWSGDGGWRYRQPTVRPGGRNRAAAARTSGAEVYILIKVSGCSSQKPIR